MKATVLCLLLWSPSLRSPAYGCALHFDASSDTGATDDSVNNLWSSNDTTVDSLTSLSNSSDGIALDANITEEAATDAVIAGCDPSNPSQCKQEFMEVCRPVAGVNQCGCPEFVERTEDGKCTLFNECADEIFNNCSSFALCVDLPEGYTCRCKAGFRDTAESEDQFPGRDCALNWTPTGSQTNELSTDSYVGLFDNQSSISSESPVIDQIYWNVNVTLGESAKNELLADSPILSNENSRNFTSDQLEFSVESRTTIASLITTISDITPDGVQEISIAANEFPETNELHPLMALTHGKLKDIFTAFDEDGNELVSLLELKQAVEKYRLTLTDADLNAMIKVADSSEDGLVNFDEFSSLMEKSF